MPRTYTLYYCTFYDYKFIGICKYYKIIDISNVDKIYSQCP